MHVSKIQSNTFAKSGFNYDSKNNKPEFIDRFADSVRNPRDINDCIAVPRGIFKAYLLIMGGSALLALANLIPAKRSLGKFSKTATVAAGWILNTLSALYFAKGFAFKGLNPTLNGHEYNKNHR